MARMPPRDPVGLAPPQPLGCGIVVAGAAASLCPRSTVAHLSLPRRRSPTGIRRPAAGRPAARRRAAARSPAPTPSAEQGVDEIEHRRLAAEIQATAAAGPRRASPRRSCRKTSRIGAAEAIDRLLVVADEKQLARREAAAAEGLDQLDLQRIGVLEFVDQQQPGLRGQPLPQAAAVRARSVDRRAWINKSLKSSAASSCLRARRHWPRRRPTASSAQRGCGGRPAGAGSKASRGSTSSIAPAAPRRRRGTAS